MMKIFSDGLPDLDELARNAWKKLRGGRGHPTMDAFRRPSSNGGGDDREPPHMPALPPLRMLATIGAGIVVALYVLAGFFAVDESEEAVMFRLGKPYAVHGPGLRFHFPLIEDYRIVQMQRVRRVEVGYRNNTKNKIARESLMLTDNLSIIDMQFVVQYVLNDAQAYLFENRSPEPAVQQVAETAMRQVVGRSDIDFVLYEGREEVAAQTKQIMQGILDRYQTGIEVRQVAVQGVQPPDQVQDAFEDAIKARQDLERKVNEGEAYANSVLPTARGQAARILAEADAYKQRAVARAEGEGRRFSLLAGEYAKAPEVTRRRLYFEAVEQVMGARNKIIVDQEEGAANLLYLPLDKMVAAGAAAARQDENFSDNTGGAGADNFGAGAAGDGGLEDLRGRLRRELERGAEAFRGQR